MILNFLLSFKRTVSGWLGIREIGSSTQMKEWFETEWAGIAQVFRLHLPMKVKNLTRQEIVYGFTPLQSIANVPATPPHSAPELSGTHELRERDLPERVQMD